MAFKTQQNAPLTDSQKEVTAKIGSMKSLLSLPFRRNKNIPKNQQISTFDYLLKILRVFDILAIPGDIVLQKQTTHLMDSREIILLEVYSVGEIPLN